jgi:VIT1/CCC1 family predicted Fe2+/Mn2+ transporter
MRRAVEAHLGSRDVAHVIYGAIIGLALVLVVQQHPPSAGVVAASLIATGVAVGLAELYSEIVGTETSTRHRVSREHLAEIGTDAVAVFFGVSFPAIFFFLAAVGAMELHTAFVWARWSGLGLIGFYGYAAGRLAGARPLACVVQALAVATIGGVLIAIKALIH